jgi:uncharacterized membrane protein
MSRNHALLLGFGFIAISIGIALWAAPHLPATVPTHWDATGHVNGYSSRFWGLALQPLVMLFLLALIVVLPAISPKGFRLDQSLPALNLIVIALLAFNFAMYVIVIRAGLGGAAPGLNVVEPAIGLLFIVIGNYLGKFRKNFFVGIRTPWTLASDEVWLKTHRLASWVFMLGGLALIAAGLLTESLIPTLVVVALIGLVPIVYSYFIYRRIEGFESHGS